MELSWYSVGTGIIVDVSVGPTLLHALEANTEAKEM